MAGKLSARTVATAKAGKYGDGRGLWLHVAPSGARKWVHRYTFAGRIREMGLGDARVVPLSEAREKSQAGRLLIARGINPIEAKRAATAATKAPGVPSFFAVADMVYEAKSPRWSKVHALQYRNSLRTHCASFGEKSIDQIDDDVLPALQKIWLTRLPTAERVRARIEETIDRAIVEGWHPLENPATWKRLQHFLPRRPKVAPAHHPALHYQDAPAYVAQLRAGPATDRLCLEWIILTAVRSGEGRGALWSEIDFAGAVWSIPPGRMKAGVAHEVPLSARCLEILDCMRRHGEAGFVFKGQRPNRPISRMALRKLLPAGCTLHGFRSSFRDWCGEETSYPREIAEAALAHVSGNQTERAYRRGTALEKRRALMEAWSQYLNGAVAGNVIALGGRK
jgi:integrase